MIWSSPIPPWRPFSPGWPFWGGRTAPRHQYGPRLSLRRRHDRPQSGKSFWPPNGSPPLHRSGAGREPRRRGAGPALPLGRRDWLYPGHGGPLWAAGRGQRDGWADIPPGTGYPRHRLFDGLRRGILPAEASGFFIQALRGLPERAMLLLLERVRSAGPARLWRRSWGWRSGCAFPVSSGIPPSVTGRRTAPCPPAAARGFPSISWRPCTPVCRWWPAM